MIDMNIVVLDGHTLNPGDLDWGELRELGSVTVHDRTPPELTVERAGDAEIVLTNKVILDRAVLDLLPNLRYIGVLATGYNVVDLAAAHERDIPVTNVPTYGTRSVAQAVFALLLELTNHVGHHAKTVREGKWTNAIDFCYWDFPQVELDGLTMGLVGFGRIGRAVAEIARAFGMNVIAHDTFVDPATVRDVRLADLDAVFSESDVVSLHCPLTGENAGLVNTARLSLMKQTAYLINTARGPLIHEQDLADALNNGRIAGAGMDVLSVEPPVESNPLLTARNCIITPHIAWATRAARKRLMDTVVNNVSAFQNGHPVNVVNA